MVQGLIVEFHGGTALCISGWSEATAIPVRPLSLQRCPRTPLIATGVTQDPSYCHRRSHRDRGHPLYPLFWGFLSQFHRRDHKHTMYLPLVTCISDYKPHVSKYRELGCLKTATYYYYKTINGQQTSNSKECNDFSESTSTLTINPDAALSEDLLATAINYEVSSY